MFSPSVIHTEDDLVNWLVNTRSIICKSEDRYYTKTIEASRLKGKKVWEGSVEVTEKIKELGCDFKRVNAEVLHRLKEMGYLRT